MAAVWFVVLCVAAGYLLIAFATETVDAALADSGIEGER
jgi:hypothetical protein